jgi:hypothetical protein
MHSSRRAEHRDALMSDIPLRDLQHTGLHVGHEEDAMK